jgi:thiamine-phosphate pyrophosphorylase
MQIGDGSSLSTHQDENLVNQGRAYSPNLVAERILDANLDRAREGLRVIEEWCRFGLKTTELTAICKDLRQALAHWHRPEFRAARNTPNDPGTTLTHAQEQERPGMTALVRANLGRVQEALRVIEEYGKLVEPELSLAAKQMRYQVYTLESNLLPDQRLEKLRQARLYLVTAPHPNLLTVVEAALQNGLSLVQYREKSLDDAARLAMARQLRELCDRYQALLIVNDRVDLALAADADGVHLGQQDVPMELARRILGPQRLVGRSTTNPTELARALDEGADYIGVGPMYETPTKPGKAAAGATYVSYAQSQVDSLPWFVIGGLDPTNLAPALAAGATRVAVVRSIMAADDPGAVTRQLLAQLKASAPPEAIAR